ncbi:High affinity immunoglobulin epsilon receptor subunit gamma Fc receptor gamma-chain [Triplophysa tibetana]|nr:High affinity immunoglobulin epsilon receptor subunit gamma Fc receptor gamma-chain [Triplophysa tibetana]KAA0719585.1 High affinity immunoglobulin epsilon receptor subunit gamma Fc receptor gamma-chain [Triplophysa tibetana]
MHLLGLSLVLLLKAGGVAAQQDTGLCYILDGILIIYGIVLTVLYVRLRKQDGGIYAGLGRQDPDHYETLPGMKKKPIA